MRAPFRIVAVVLLSFALGLHWAALQSAAWTSMLIERIQSASLADALRTTFDGKHPCNICIVVRDGRAAEQGNPAASTEAGKQSPQLELTLSPAPWLWVLDPPACMPAVTTVMGFAARLDPPPIPPPRFA